MLHRAFLHVVRDGVTAGTTGTVDDQLILEALLAVGDRLDAFATQRMEFSAVRMVRC